MWLVVSWQKTLGYELIVILKNKLIVINDGICKSFFDENADEVKRTFSRLDPITHQCTRGWEDLDLRRLHTNWKWSFGSRINGINEHKVWNAASRQLLGFFHG